MQRFCAKWKRFILQVGEVYEGMFSCASTVCNKKTSTEWQIQMQRIPKVLLDPDPFFIAPYPILAGSIGKEDTKF